MQRRIVFALPLASLLALGIVSSCRDVVVGDRVDGVDELCRLLVSCYGDAFDCEALAARVDAYAGDGSDADVRKSFLNGFEEAGCLQNCAKAKLCLDAPLFCGNNTCVHDYDCCDWSLGTRACRGGDGPDAGYCCKPNGIDCKTDGDCCDARCLNGSCGGYSCKMLDAPCKTSGECCTGHCDPSGVCAVKDCVDPGDTCAQDEDCCALDDAPAGQAPHCIEQRCVFEVPCRKEGEQCGEGAGLTCCTDGAPLECVADPNGTGVCGIPGCAAAEQSCMEAGDCCEGLSCNPNTSTCTPPIDCLPDGASCMTTEDCCFGACFQSVCIALCVSPVCHDICVEGEPLQPSCGADPAELACITAVIAADDYCGCQGWDWTCTDEVGQYCNTACF